VGLLSFPDERYVYIDLETWRLREVEDTTRGYMSLVIWRSGLLKIWDVERKSFALEGTKLKQYAFDERKIEHDDLLLEAEYDLTEYARPEVGVKAEQHFDHAHAIVLRHNDKERKALILCTDKESLFKQWMLKLSAK
jgi:hypothetical protein